MRMLMNVNGEYSGRVGDELANGRELEERTETHERLDDNAGD